MLNASSILFRINLLSQNLLTLALSPAWFSCMVALAVFFFFGLVGCHLEKEGKKMEACSMVANTVYDFS